MKLSKKLYRLKEFLRIAMARLRVYAVQLQGGRVHSKCLFGYGVKIERPWLVEMGPRCVLEPFVWLNVGAEEARLTIGEHTFIGRYTEIEISTHVSIGKNVLIAPGVFITDHHHDTKLGEPMRVQPCVPGSVQIGDDVWIGANSVILPDVRIGAGAIVGAGAVVTQDVPSNTIVAGVPARVLRTRGGPQ